jgi:hypothetical protein
MSLQSHRLALFSLLGTSVAAALLAAITLAQVSPAPSPEHQRLQELSGTWDVSIEMLGANGDASRSSGVSEMKPLLGGFWIVEDFAGELGGTQVQGHGVLGFDPARAKYVHTWIDSMSPMPSTSEGSYDKGGKVLSMVGTGPGPHGKLAQVRSTFTWKNDDTAVCEMSTAEPSGKETSKLKITYARRVGTAVVRAMRPIVDDIVRADYRADLEALARAHTQLAAYAADAAVKDAVHYWRGFAQWRSAMNRMNAPDFDHALAQREMRDAASEFEAIKSAELLGDAKSANAGCLMSLAYLAGVNDPEARTLIHQFQALIADAVLAEPNNPRVLWIRGGQLLWTPAQFGGSREVSIETYQRGLACARAQHAASSDSLAPRWGEPEMLMSLAYAYANSEPNDLARAEEYARQALALQPEWHYVKDVLLPSIATKRGDK